jgi:hypothetical protein
MQAVSRWVVIAALAGLVVAFAWKLNTPPAPDAVDDILVKYAAPPSSSGLGDAAFVALATVSNALNGRALHRMFDIAGGFALWAAFVRYLRDKQAAKNPESAR